MPSRPSTRSPFTHLRRNIVRSQRKKPAAQYIAIHPGSRPRPVNRGKVMPSTSWVDAVTVNGKYTGWGSRPPTGIKNTCPAPVPATSQIRVVTRYEAQRTARV